MVSAHEVSTCFSCNAASSLRIHRRPISWALPVVALVIGAIWFWFYIFTKFRVYDDEGWMMMYVRLNSSDGHPPTTARMLVGGPLLRIAVADFRAASRPVNE